jgi:glucose/arabinose dehydrogenase
VNPWSLTFLPNGDMLVTEKPGRLRVVRNGDLETQPVSAVPEVWATGQGGLLEVLPHPRFSENQLLYLTYSKACEKGATTALHRARFDGKALIDGRDIFVADNCNTGNPHFGSKLAFARDGLLYMTIGERGDRNRSQNTASHGGKILRLKDDGTVPPDNPFVGKEGYKPEIFSYGHRNAQGLAFHPESGVLWSHEHGPQGGDELNIVQAGKNYGWPIAGYGREYAPDGAIVSQQPSKEGIEEPVLIWSPSIGISGLIIYTGDAFPHWKGNFFAGALSGMALHRIGFNEKGGLLGREALLMQARQRVRDVRQGPDGHIYLAIDANPGGVLRLEPAAAAAKTTSAGQ